MPNADHIQISIDRVNITTSNERTVQLCDEILQSIQEIKVMLKEADGVRCDKD